MEIEAGGLMARYILSFAMCIGGLMARKRVSLPNSSLYRNLKWIIYGTQ